MRSVFFCIDGHTAGNPVRLVAGGAPNLRGRTMAARRLDFLGRFDWIRTSLCFEPRGHNMMSGGFLFPPTSENADVALLFIETSGCLPMCGHGTIGLLTFGIENGLIQPRRDGKLVVDVPAGQIDVDYRVDGSRVSSVRLRNVASYLAEPGVEIETATLGKLTVDVAYGGNYYAIVEPQGPYRGLVSATATDLVSWSREVRAAVNRACEPVHPDEESIRGVSHVLWADEPSNPEAAARNAVFYGQSAIDRSPCGTGTSARMAQLVAKGRLGVGDRFVHESYIGSLFTGRVESAARVGPFDGIVPSIEGRAFATGFNTIWVDRSEPFCNGFEVV